jgi:uncharacterized protein YuzE
MSIRLANVEFDQVDYDREADVLYLSAGDPSRATDFDESPEGHHTRFDASGALVGVTIVNARWLLDNEGRIRITLPETLTAAELGPALAI